MFEEAEEQEESVWHALTDPNQRASTWISVIIGIFNIFSGIGIINIYVTAIFESILKKGAVARLTAKEDAYFMGLAGVTGAFLSYYSVAIFTRRALFIGGHFFMGALQLMCGFFIQIN